MSTDSVIAFSLLTILLALLGILLVIIYLVFIIRDALEDDS